MRKTIFSVTALFALLLCALSCSKSNQQLVAINNQQSTIISEQSALSNLDNFLGQTKSTLGENTARSISTYSFDDSNINTPDLYLVNYENEHGCAILAANTHYPEILAVIDNGNIDNDLQVICSSNEKIEETATVQQLVDNTRHFCLEIRETGLKSGVVSKTFAQCPILLNFSWSQGNYNQCGIYNKYCITENISYYPYAGCACAAIASIIAYNAFPTLCVNGQTLDYQEMTSRYTPDKLSDEYQEQVSLLYGTVFNKSYKICLQDYGTMSFPISVKKTLERFGYENVRILSDHNFYDLMWEISDMLEKRKPAIFLAMASNTITDAHYWIIDGAKQANYGDQLLHFNFCWEGNYNGWFSIYSVFNPAEAYEYDNNETKDLMKNGTMDDDKTDYTRFYHLYTYDIPLNKEEYEQSYSL